MVNLTKKGEHMTYQEFKVKLQNIKDKAKIEENQLIKRYCEANYNFKKGDVIKGSHISIIIDKITYGYPLFSENYGKPICYYYGYVLTKKGALRKDKYRGCITSDKAILVRIGNKNET